MIAEKYVHMDLMKISIERFDNSFIWWEQETLDTGSLQDHRWQQRYYYIGETFAGWQCWWWIILVRVLASIWTGGLFCFLVRQWVWIHRSVVPKFAGYTSSGIACFYEYIQRQKRDDVSNSGDINGKIYATEIILRVSFATFIKSGGTVHLLIFQEQKELCWQIEMLSLS